MTETLPRPAGTLPELKAENERLRAELKRLKQGGPMRRLHRAIALGMDHILPPGLKTKLLSTVLAVIAMGPSVAADVIPLPQAWQDWAYHIYTVNPGKWALLSLVLLYLTWAARDAVHYREEDKHDA